MDSVAIHAPVRRDDDMDSYGRTHEANITAITVQMQQDAIASLATIPNEPGSVNAFIRSVVEFNK
jgi:hypothetical protein